MEVDFFIPDGLKELVSQNLSGSKKGFANLADDDGMIRFGFRIGVPNAHGGNKKPTQEKQKFQSDTDVHEKFLSFLKNGFPNPNAQSQVSVPQNSGPTTSKSESKSNDSKKNEGEDFFDPKRACNPQ